MRHNSRVLPLLGMALYFCVVSLGAALAMVSGDFTGTGRLPALVHMAGVFAFALGLSLSLQRSAQARKKALESMDGAGQAAGPWWKRPLPLLLLLVSLSCLAVPFLTSGDRVPHWTFLLPQAIATCFFFPVGLHVFFSCVPASRHGTFLGLAMASGELVWLVILPALYVLLNSGDNASIILYVYKLLGFALAGMGICLFFALNGMQHPYSKTSPSSVAEASSPGSFRDLVRTIRSSSAGRSFIWLFTGAALFYLLFGLILLAFPKASHSFGFFSNIHFFLVLAAPIAGMLVDGLVLERFRPQSSGLVFFLLFALCPAVAAAPFLTLIYGLGVSDELSTLLLVTRQAMLLVLLVVTARFVGRSPWFPLLACIFWNFMLLHLAGIDLGFFLEAVPDVRMAVIFAVAAASVLCLCRFARSLRAVPELAAVAPELSPEEGLPPGEPVLQERQIDAAKLDAFGAAFDLTSRELQTLEFLLRYKEIALIAQGLAISERTVRFHFTGLFRKTGVSNKQRLMHFYTSWEA